MPDTRLLKVIISARENETAAVEFYEKAARNETNPVGKNLFNQLAKYEDFHYEKLSILARSLTEKGEFIKYERQEPPTAPRLVLRGDGVPENSSILKTLKHAVETEKDAEMSYLKLADEISDPDGHYMFSRLSEEEHLHFHILKEIIWNLNHTGNWEWTVH